MTEPDNPFQETEEAERNDFWLRRYNLSWYGPRILASYPPREWPAVIFDGPGIAIRVDINHRLEKRFLNMALATAINQIHREVHDYIDAFEPSTRKEPDENEPSSQEEQ